MSGSTSSNCSVLLTTLVSDVVSDAYTAISNNIGPIAQKVGTAISNGISTLLSSANVTKCLSAISNCSCGTSSDSSTPQVPSDNSKTVDKDKDNDSTSFVDFPSPFDSRVSGPEASTTITTPTQNDKERKTWTTQSKKAVPQRASVASKYKSETSGFTPFV